MSKHDKFGDEPFEDKPFDAAPLAPKVAPASLGIKTFEQWAEFRGHVNHGHQPGDYENGGTLRPRLVGPHAAFDERKDLAVHYLMAKRIRGGALGITSTLAEYDAAVEEAGNVSIGGPAAKGA